MKKAYTNSEGNVVTQKPKLSKASLASLQRSIKPVNYFTDAELAAVPAGDCFVFDSEAFPNFWYVAFKHIKSGKVVAFEDSAAFTLNHSKLLWMLWRFLLVGFNSNLYDIPLLMCAAKGFKAETLKQISDQIILQNLRPWDIEREYKIRIPKINTIDLVEVAPLEGSLKLYAGRLHCERMQDLPFDPNHILNEEEAEITRLYCCNDLDNTQLLMQELWPQLELRMQMTEQYGVDLRSKSDAQVAEAVINSELAKLTGHFPKKPTFNPAARLRYNVPAYVQYQASALLALLEAVKAAEFDLDGNGSPIVPPGLLGYTVVIGATTYKIGAGGLHSQEETIAHIATNETIISDDDVESFYPRIILNQQLFPPHLGLDFLTVYEQIVNARLQAKKDGNKIVADSLKITINGSFGKLGNKYSTIYAPQLMLQVTITGQLVLLMLIEMLENVGISVVSGNTDGIVSKYHKSKNELKKQTIQEWERLTRFKTEQTLYAATYNRDVNNYIAVKLKDGKLDGCKVKGVYSEKGSALNSVLSKNPETLIISDAIQKLLLENIPVEKTISECKDLRRFISVRNVKGGGEKDGVYLGKVVRWYYAKDEAGQINYVLSGNKVPKSEGAKPLMDLPLQLPNDLNYEWYIKAVKTALYDIGYLRKPATLSLW